MATLQQQPMPQATPQKISPAVTDKVDAAKVLGTMSAKNFSKADEVRDFPKGKLELVRFGDSVVGRATLQPGWRWSNSLKEIAGTDSCEAAHFQYHAAGTLRIHMDDGTEIECRAGDVSMIPPGHDAWVVGDEPVVLIDFQGMSHYAQSAQAKH